MMYMNDGLDQTDPKLMYADTLIPTRVEYTNLFPTSVLLLSFANSEEVYLPWNHSTVVQTLLFQTVTSVHFCIAIMDSTCNAMHFF